MNSQTETTPEDQKVYSYKRIRFFAVWVCIFGAEVALIILSTRKFGPTLTFYLVVGPAFAGLAIQLIRWFRLKPMREEATRLFQKIDFKSIKKEDAATSPAVRVWWPLARVAVMEYWYITFLLLIPGFYCHLTAFLLIVPMTRRLGWFLLTGRWDYPSIPESGSRLKA